MKYAVKGTFAIALVVGLLSAARGGLINYGDFIADTVTYEGVTEDSNTDPPPLYGPPTLAGNSLSFAPVSFGSSSNGAGGVDITDGTLTMLISAHPGNAIEVVKLHEAGDYTLIGPGGAGTYAAVSAAVFVTVLEVAGEDDFSPLHFNANMVFTPSGGDYDLSNDGPGTAVIWEGDLTVDISGILAAANQGIQILLPVIQHEAQPVALLVIIPQTPEKLSLHGVNA